MRYGDIGIRFGADSHLDKEHYFCKIRNAHFYKVVNASEECYLEMEIWIIPSMPNILGWVLPAYTPSY